MKKKNNFGINILLGIILFCVFVILIEVVFNPHLEEQNCDNSFNLVTLTKFDNIERVEGKIDFVCSSGVVIQKLKSTYFKYDGSNEGGWNSIEYCAYTYKCDKHKLKIGFLKK